MPNENFLSNSVIQEKIEAIWKETCGTWENCNETTIQSFLSKCEKQSIDPQFCMSWVEQHKEQIPNWSNVSEISLDWVNQHTSSGSTISAQDQNWK